MHDVASILIQGHETLRTALERMNRSGRTVLLLVASDGRLLRTVTDGDLRRILLAGSDLDATLVGLPPFLASRLRRLGGNLNRWGKGGAWPPRPSHKLSEGLGAKGALPSESGQAWSAPVARAQFLPVDGAKGSFR